MRNFTFLFCFLIFTGLLLAGPVCVDTPPMTIPSPPICSDAPGLGDRIILPDSADFFTKVFWEDLNASVAGTSYFGLSGDGDVDDGLVWIIGDWLKRTITMFWASPNLDLAVYLNTISPVGHETQGISRESDAPNGVVLNIPWVPGEELVLQNRVTYEPKNINDIWYTGPGERNADGKKHAIVRTTLIPVEEPEEPEPIPEPSTFLLIGGGLMATAMIRRRQKREA